MRKIPLKFCWQMIFLLLAISISAIGGGQVKASILRYEPAPAEQGNTFDVWVQLVNIGTKADRVAIKFEPEYPFSLPEGANGEVDVGLLAATETKVVKFSVYVDPSAPNGDRNIKFLYKYSSVDEWTRLETPITLQTQNAALVIEDYSVTPSPVKPGQAATVELNIKNTGKIAVKNLDVSLDLDELAFSTFGSGTKKRIDYVSEGQSKKVTFQLASDTSTQVKLYALPVTLSYQDERNKQYNDSAKISIPVNAQPELSVTVESTEFVTKTMPGQVSLKIVNKGIVNLKYLTARLVQTQDYEILSPSNEAYVGNLDSDDFETVDFTIKPLVTNPRLSAILEFKDPYNMDFTQRYDLPLRIITDEDLGKSSSPVPKIALGVLVLAAVLYWFARRRKKR